MMAAAVAKATNFVVGADSRAGAFSLVAVAAAEAIIVLLPGDLSAPRERMVRDPELAPFAAWSVESIAELLAKRWPQCHALVVHPPRLEDGFVCYDGWLNQLDQSGDPIGGYTRAGTACTALLGHIGRAQVALMDTASRDSPDPATLPLRLVSFSHGAVALNQVLAEVCGLERTDDAYSEAGAPASAAGEILERTQSWVWLDPGLAQEPGAGLLLGDRGLLRTGARRLRERAKATSDAGGESRPRGVQIAVALTPYQRQPPESWIRGWRLAWSWPPLLRESCAAAARRRFLRTLRREGLESDDSNVALHSEDCLTDREASLENHFEVLNAFSAPWDAARRQK
jgi:hypothetical protein